MPLHKQTLDLLKDKLDNYNVFIETGLFKGQTLSNVVDRFNKCYSIELNQTYIDQQKPKFKKYKHVELVQGDSGETLAKVLQDVHEPAVIFLDAHGHDLKSSSVNAPLIKELTAIKNHPLAEKHLILIDDYYFVKDQIYLDERFRWCLKQTDDDVVKLLKSIHGTTAKIEAIPYPKDVEHTDWKDNYILLSTL